MVDVLFTLLLVEIIEEKIEQSFVISFYYPTFKDGETVEFF